MAKFNSDVVFIDMSGQVRVIHGDLTLRANPDGDGHIIIGSGISLRPEVNCDASDAIDLGQETHRWKTLFSCSGNFLDRPTVNGSGVLLQGDTVPASVAAGVDTLNGLSGVVTLASVNDAITITENSQTIEFSGIFTQASGSLLENVADLVGSGVVNRLNGLSGLVDIASLNDGLTVTVNGQTIQLGSMFDSASGVLLDTISNLVGSGVVNRLNGLSGVVDLATEDGLSLLIDGQVIRFNPSFNSTSGVLLDTISDLVASGVVNRLNGLSGIIDLTTADGMTINIFGQAIELDPSFNSVSGVLLNTVSDLVGSGVVNRLNGLSGLVTISSGISNIIQVTSSAESGILLDLDISLLEQTLSLSGIAKQEAAASEDFASTTSNTFVEVLTLDFDVALSGIYRAQWSFQGGCSAANKVTEFRIQIDDSALLSDFMDMTTSFNVGGTGDGLQFGGFRQFGADVGMHSLDFDMRFADTGGAAVQISNLRLEILQVV